MAITVTHKNTEDETSEAMFGEHEHLQYAAEVTFPELVFESLSGQKPDEKQLKLFNLILDLCFDHGPNPPSESATITATKEGKGMGEAVAAGIAQINNRHGGAIEPGMRFFELIKKGEDVQKLVDEYIEQKKIIGGFGHRIYEKEDPRAELILKELGVSEYIEIARKVQDAIKKNKGRGLVLNVDGAIAVVLCTWGWQAEWSKAIFIIARSAGLCAHFLNNS